MIPAPTLPASELADRLRVLFAERAAAARAGLADNRSHMDDLEHEISGCRDAYVGAAVTEIAVLRSVLGSALFG